jgi:hypothetical protein
MTDVVHFCREEGVDLDGKISAVVDQGTPEFPAFPPAFISGVGAEHEEHGDRETQEGVKDREVFGMAGFPKFKVNGFQVHHPPGIETHQQYGWKQFAEGVCFMDLEYG